jgi:hypothetical protein
VPEQDSETPANTDEAAGQQRAQAHVPPHPHVGRHPDSDEQRDGDVDVRQGQRAEPVEEEGVPRAFPTMKLAMTRNR